MSKLLDCITAAGLLLSGACVDLSTLIAYNPTAPPPREMRPRPWKQVEFRTSAPKEPYTAVGTVEIADNTKDRPRVVMQAMMERAGQAGCDGVIWLGKTEAVVQQEGNVLPMGDFWVTGPGFTEKLEGYRMSCFVYNSPLVRTASTQTDD